MARRFLLVKFVHSPELAYLTCVRRKKLLNAHAKKVFSKLKF